MSVEHEVHALIPDPKYGWLVVVDVAQLVGYLLDPDYDLQDAIDNAGIDTETGGSANVRTLIERVRRLNNTGDAESYWSPAEETEQQ